MKTSHKLLIGAGIVASGLLLIHPTPTTYPPHTLPPQGYGVTNPDITQANINQTICNTTWSTKSIRPPVSYTNKLKAQDLQDPSYTDKNMADYELDHIISLELGGHPSDPKNLYPEPYDNIVNGLDLGAKSKDKVENYLHKQVCDGKISLVEAQNEIKTDWVAVYRQIK
jgi:hypothetical protein